MKRSIVTLMAVLGLVVGGFLAPAPAWGTDKYFCADTDNTWNDDGNWKEYDPGAGGNCGNGTASTKPTAADRAIIVSGKTCNVDVPTAVADSLNVESTATLNIQASQKLTLDDTAGSKTTIAGTLNLQGSGSELAFTSNSQTIDGAGKIVGQNNAAKITVSDGETLTNDATIEGKLAITDNTINGTFLNHGIVHANVAGTLEISTNSFDDDSTALWKISASSSAILKIDATSTTKAVLEGDFEIFDDGKLVVGSPGFETTGSLVWKGGTIDVASSSLADFGWFADP